MEPMEQVDRVLDLPLPTRRDHEAAQSPPGGEPQTAKSKRRAEDSSEDCASGMAKRSRGTTLAVDRFVEFFIYLFLPSISSIILMHPLFFFFSQSNVPDESVVAAVVVPEQQQDAVALSGSLGHLSALPGACEMNSHFFSCLKKKTHLPI